MMSICRKKIVYVVQNSQAFDSVFSEFRFAEDYVKKCPCNECRSVIRVELQDDYCENMLPQQKMHRQSKAFIDLSPEEKEALELMFENISDN